MKLTGIIVRYGEIALKKKNRKKFENELKVNIRKLLKREGYEDSEVLRLHGRFYITGEFFDERFLNYLTLIPGIHSFSKVNRIDTQDPDIILEKVFEHFMATMPKDYFSFKAQVKRADKKFPMTSIQFEIKIAEYIGEKINDELMTIDLKNPDYKMEVDIRYEGTFIFHERISGSRGLPIGSSGKFLSLLSGGIDSPVASYLMMNRGGYIDCLSFYSPPYIGEESKTKIKMLVDKLAIIQGRIKLYIVPFTKIQETIRDTVPDEFRTIFYRRFMFEIGNLIAEEYHYSAFVTGEALGQVASQTIQNITCIEDAANYPVLRPLISSEKEDIVNIAKKIDTFDISIMPAPDTCTLFAPDRPKIKGRLKDIHKYEERLDKEALLTECMKGIELYEVR